MTTTSHRPEMGTTENQPAGPGTGFATVRREDPLFHEAWQNDIAEDSVCPFCGHHAGHHTMVVTTPHFYEPVQPEDLLASPHQPSWPHPVNPDLGKVKLVQISEKQEVLLMQCRACALNLHTNVATCLSVSLGYGAVKKAAPPRKPKAAAGGRIILKAEEAQPCQKTISPAPTHPATTTRRPATKG